MRSKLSIRRKISVFSIDYDIQSKPLANIDMIAVIFHPLGLNPFVRCSMSELYNHYIDVEDLEDIELNHLKRNISACLLYTSDAADD